MQTWEKQEKARVLRDKLNLFNKSQYKNAKLLNQEERGFIDRYRVREFFLALLKSFNPEIHSAHSQPRVQELIGRWNENNPTAKTTMEYLENNYFLIRNRNRVVVNPFLRDREMPEAGIFMLIREIQELRYSYPFFARESFEKLLTAHNEEFQTELTSDLLLGSETSLCDTIFRNYLGQKSAFNEALGIYFCSISFETLGKNAYLYGQLLIELYKAEIDVSLCLRNMDSTKKKPILDYIIQQLVRGKIKGMNFGH